MILRKPYALLIKHFKLIHIILALPIMYLAIKTSAIISFLNNYISSGFVTTGVNIAGNYINFFMVLAVLVVIGVASAIYILLKRKEKNTKFYIAIIAYYILFAIILSIYYGVLENIEFGALEPSTVRAYRDIATMIFVPQIFYIIYSIIRGIGFDFKSFDFKADLAEIEIEEQDNEEFELNVGFENYKVKRYIRKFIREFVYYIKENSFFWTWIGGIIGSVFAVFLIINIFLNNHKYSEAQAFNFSGFHVTIKESMLTSYDYGGTLILQDKTYLAVKVNITNRSSVRQEFDLKDFRLIEDGKDPIYPIVDRSFYFIDYGIPYKGNALRPGESNDYVLVYDVNSDAKSYIIQLVDSIKYGAGEINAKYKQTLLKPNVVEKSEDKGVYKINDDIFFSESNLESTTLIVNNYRIGDSYKYDYNFCYASNCFVSTGVVSVDYNVVGSSQTLLTLKYLLDLDETTPFFNSIDNNLHFFSYLSRVKYTINGETKYSKVINKTPRELVGYVILQTTDNIKKADTVELQFVVRNKIYTLVLKG